jgi:hypothetical protein
MKYEKEYKIKGISGEETYSKLHKKFISLVIFTQ